MARSHLKLEKILCQVIEPKEAGTYLREYLISAVDRLTQVNQGGNDQSSMHIHIESYMCHWERATYAERELKLEEWQAFRSLFNQLCERMRQLVDENK